MMPAPKRDALMLRAGMAGIRFPGYVGTWRVKSVMPAHDADGGDVSLFVVANERLAKAAPMLVTQTGRVVFGRIPAFDFEGELEMKGYTL